MSCFDCIVWQSQYLSSLHSLANIFGFISSSCIVGFVCCFVFVLSSQLILLCFSFFLCIFAFWSNFLIYPSGLIRHPVLYFCSSSTEVHPFYHRIPLLLYNLARLIQKCCPFIFCIFSLVRLDWLSWHISPCRLFNAKSSLFIYIKYMICKYFVYNIFKRDHVQFLAHCQMLSGIFSYESFYL